MHTSFGWNWLISDSTLEKVNCINSLEFFVYREIIRIFWCDLFIFFAIGNTRKFLWFLYTKKWFEKIFFILLFITNGLINRRVFFALYRSTCKLNKRICSFYESCCKPRPISKKLAAALTANRPKTRTPLCSSKQAYFDIKGRDFVFNWTKSLRAKKTANKDGLSAFLLCRRKPPRRRDVYAYIGCPDFTVYLSVN